MARNKDRQAAARCRGIAWAACIEEFIAWMRVRNTAEYTQHNRRACVAQFVRWAERARHRRPDGSDAPGAGELSAVSLLLPAEKRDSR